MCGIIGYVGDKDAASVLVKGLASLEYRGYDSAGIAVIEEDNLKSIKRKGRLLELQKCLENNELSGCVGIGHTRWATHGVPNDINSHPHVSKQNMFAVVHNGIIENYIELQNKLKSEGIECISDTDTEIIAHLIEYYYDGDFLKAVIKAVNELEGSYALGIVCKDYNDMFIAVRKNSPLVVGIGEGENFIASDITPLLEYTKKIYILEDREMVILNKDDVKILDENGNQISKSIFHVHWNVSAAEKDGFEHFMLKEIFEEPKVIGDTINPRIKNDKVNLGEVCISAQDLKCIDKICIVGCGTAYHAGILGKHIIQKLTKIPVEVDVASEFRYNDPIVNEKTLLIVISQSGETIDTLFALREAKKRGARVVSIVNVVGSSIARESEQVLYTGAGPEIAVASTKAYNAQIAAVYLLAIHMGSTLGILDEEKEIELIHQLKGIPAAIEDVLKTTEKQIQNIANRYHSAKNVFYIGRNLDYALCMEGSLKLKEISYIHSEAYAGGELKHGTIALIEEGTLVICVLTQDWLVDKMVGNIKEVKARGATVIVVTQCYNFSIEKIVDEVIFIPDVTPLFAPLVGVTPLQLLAYYMAVRKCCDVDKPRNLAKSVTVE